VRWGISLSGSRAQAVSTGLTLPLGPRKRGITSSHLRNVLGGSPLVTGSRSWGSDCGRCSRIKRSRSSVSPSPIPKTPRHSRSLFFRQNVWGEEILFQLAPLDDPADKPPDGWRRHLPAHVLSSATLLNECSLTRPEYEVAHRCRLPCLAPGVVVGWGLQNVCCGWSRGKGFSHPTSGSGEDRNLESRL
jgi:hypothetical protein